MTVPFDFPVGGEQSAVGLAVGDRFIFRGLVGQEQFDQRLPGSGSVGWLIEVISVAPWGIVSVTCVQQIPEEDSQRRGFSVPYSDVVVMVRDGVWIPTT